jgi:very-short-patch-repair endonuclease
MSVARALIEVAATAGDAELERALAEARVQRLLRPGALEHALDRAGNLAGVARMRALLAGEETPAITRSEAERIMRRLLRDAGLPMPLINARVAGFEVDFYWAKQKVVVEVDGYQFHGHRGAFERDRRKGLVLAAAGINVIRITWRQLVAQPVWLAVQLARALVDQS